MENENLEQIEVVETKPSPLHTVTPLSKYLAMLLFVAMPFIGGWVGYTYAPEKVVDVMITTEKVSEHLPSTDTHQSTEIQGVLMTGESYQESLIFPKDRSVRLPILHSGDGFIFMNRQTPGDRVAVYKLAVPDFEGGYKYKSVDSHYIKSDNNVIFTGIYGFAPRIVVEADPDTFAPLDLGFMRDAESIFYLGEKLRGITPEEVTFTTITTDSNLAEQQIMQTNNTAWVPEGCGPFIYEPIEIDALTEWQPC